MDPLVALDTSCANQKRGFSPDSQDLQESPWRKTTEAPVTRSPTGRRITEASEKVHLAPRQPKVTEVC